MTPKQKMMAGVGIAAIVVAFISIYAMYQESRDGVASQDAQGTSQMVEEEPKTVPSSVEGITDAIIAEMVNDIDALDQEEANAQAQVQADAAVISDLENSYDESNY